MKYLKILPLIFLFFLTSILLIKIINYDKSKGIESALLNKNFPKLNISLLDTKEQKHIDFNIGENFILINFFASWCVPCKVEHETLNFINRDGIPIFGIAYKDKTEDTKFFLKALGNPYKQVGIDRNGRIAIELGVYGVPETFLVDLEGIIRYRHAGPLTIEDYKKKIIPLIN